MAKVVEKRPDGSTVVIVPAADAAGLEIGTSVDVSRAADSREGSRPWPFGAFEGKFAPFEIEEIKAARGEALSGKAR